VLIVGAALRSAAATRAAWTPLNVAHHRVSRISAFLLVIQLFPQLAMKEQQLSVAATLFS
jgi:hypothetical protein